MVIDNLEQIRMEPVLGKVLDTNNNYKNEEISN